MKNNFPKDIYNFIPLGANKDISVLEVSYRKKHPEVSKKPMSKNYYALHLILAGSGKLDTPDGSYAIKRGDIFVRFPNEIIAYYDYEQTPFNYIFVTFQGSAIKSYLAKCEISKQNRVFPTTPELTYLFRKIVADCRDNPAVSDMLAAGYMQFIFAEIAKKHVHAGAKTYTVKGNYVNNAIEFIDSNISNCDLDANYVAEYVNLNCDYFLRIFKEITGIPFSKFLTAKRMNLAAKLLKEEKDVSVVKISEMLGYSSPAYFSKIFRKNFNQSPSRFAGQPDDNETEQK